jgi:archaeosine synthase beta-subunit
VTFRYAGGRVNEPYSDTATGRDHWIIARRPPRAAVAADRPHSFFIEEERSEAGEVVSVATIFLTNRECPWRCLMCDLWKYTLEESVPPGAIPAQIDFALGELLRTNAMPLRQVKLYNSGSFFDRGAIPLSDLPAIAERLRGFERVIVECHPALVNDAAVRFRDSLGGAKLEVAMGLETIHPEVLPRLNKRMAKEQFAAAADFLHRHEIALRAFVLVKPPFLDEGEALLWAQRSTEFAFDCGATVVSLIPVRPGNGALDELAAQGHFSPPKLRTLERAAEHGVAMKRGRVFADTWDLEQFSRCPSCFAARRERLNTMNLSQVVPESVRCPHCANP